MFKHTIVLTREDIVFEVHWSSSLKAKTKMCLNNTAIVTQEEGVIYKHSISFEGLTHCNHEKADTRICLLS